MTKGIDPAQAYNKPPPRLDYFKQEQKIGSSILADSIESLELAAQKKYGSKFMGDGKVWEDFLEYQITGLPYFWGKYYLSEFDNLPQCSCHPSISDLVDSNKVKDSYVYNGDGKTPKKGGWNELLAEIEENGKPYLKQPISLNLWVNIKKAWTNFQNVIFTDKEGEVKINLVELLSGGEWQFENYWNEGEIECRQKLDVWAPALTGGGARKDFILDIKFTSSLSQFNKFWKSKYIWQDVHYCAGFKKLMMARDGINWDDSMYFIVTENKEPFMTYLFHLSGEDFMYLQDLYYMNLERCWKWIKAGKPTRGWMPTQSLDKYGRVRNNLF